MKLTPSLFSVLLLVQVFLMVAPGCAYAKDDATDPSYAIEKDVQKTVVNIDGSYQFTQESVTVINEERAIKELAQAQFAYDTTREDLEIVEAYTLKKDGRKIPVQADQIKDQLERQFVGAPMFGDLHVKVISFPELAVGDRIVTIYKRHCKVPIYPGYFTDMSYAPFAPVKQFSVSYDVPADMHLEIDNKGFKASEPVAAAGRKVYQWDYVGGENHRVEGGSVSYFDYGRRLLVSNFPDAAAMAKAYEARAADKAVVTPEIDALVKSLTAKIADPRAKAYAINDWVRNNIRYVGVEIGVGGVVPHSSETILSNRYGDCKDHATLMETMLKAAGIDSTSVLINAGNSYKPQKVVVGFNHAITYISSLDLFLDSTADSIGAGYLPSMDMDKEVLLIKTGQLAHTPASQANRIVSKSDFKIDVDGASSFSNIWEIVGSNAEPMRRHYRDVKPNDLARLVEVMLKQRGQRGSGTVDPGDVHGNGDTYTVHAKGQSENMINLPGPVGFAVTGGTTNLVATYVMDLATEKVRTQDFSCLAGDYVEESNYELAPELGVLAIPKPLTVHDDIFDYTSEYVRSEHSVQVKRHFTLHHKDAVCTVAEYNKMRPALDRMVHDLKAQIIVQKL